MSPSDERTDEALLGAYIGGEGTALRTLIERHHDRLLRFLIRFIGDRQAAEDVFQETFLQVHLSGETFDGKRSFRPWLYTIAANKARDWLRRRARRSALPLSAPIERDGGVTFVDLMEQGDPPPTRRLDEEERDLQVQRVVNGMPEHLREILLLAYFQRMSYAQVAEALGIPLGTVKSRLHAAVASFAKAWKALAETDEEGAS